MPKVPPHRKCGAMEVHHRLLEQFPDFRRVQADLEHTTRARRMAAPQQPSKPIDVPVVVHVVWKTDEENISDEQVKSQIDALNRDYNAQNADRTQTPPAWNGLVSDAKMHFHLTETDPAGAPTNGITRTQTANAEFSNDDSVKSTARGGIDPWPTDRYLNLWVCTLGGGLLGYAQFPGGPAATDGVVILNSAFGTSGTATAPFNLGRTATHEVGHFFNLRHIWGDTEDCSGTDFVDDTPNAQLPNYGAPEFPHISCENGPSGDMFMNYMDYVDDRIMVMFTAGQVLRMHTAIDTTRAKLAASTA